MYYVLLVCLADALSVTNATTDLRVDVLLFANPFRERLLATVLTPVVFFRFPIKLGHKLFGAKVRFGVSVTSDAPSHRKLLVLIDDFHLVDSSVARFATDTRIDVGRMVKEHKLGQVVNAFPRHALTGFPTLMNRSQFLAARVYGSQSSLLLVVFWAVAVDASRRGWDRRVSRIKDSVVTVAAIHFQLASMDCVAKGNRLFRLVTNVQRDRIGRQTTHDRSGDGTKAHSNAQTD